MSPLGAVERSASTVNAWCDRVPYWKYPKEALGFEG
jgi:hypothetical protein